MSTKPHRFILILIGSYLLSVGAAVAQETEALFLPDDQDRLDELTIRGTRWTPALAGLTRMEVPDSNITYYIIDQAAALQGGIADSLASVWQNDSDISIRFGLFGDEFAHLRRDAEHFDVRYFRFEEALPIQLRKFLEGGGFSSGGRSVEFREYRIASDVCPELDTAIRRIESRLSSSMSGIGRRSEAGEPEEITLDGAYYWLNVKMSRLLVGHFGVGANAGPLYEAVHSFARTLRECGMHLEPQIRTSDF